MTASIVMRDQTIIAGIGRTAVDRDPAADVVGHIGRALRQARLAMPGSTRQTSGKF
jgi:hypothetical protein